MRVDAARVSLVIALAALASADCKRRQQPYPETVRAATDDSEMNAAIAQARSTLDSFVNALRSPSPTQHDFSIKARFDGGGHTEHMWISPVEFDGAQFSGLLNDEPVELKSPKRDERVVVDASRVSDWMFVDGKKLRGGYTLRVMRARLSPAERRELDRSLGYDFD